MDLLGITKCLADKNRLQILRILLNSNLYVGALAQHRGISKPAVSQHLQVLRKAGLVRGEKRGYWTHYEVDRSALERVATELSALAVTDNSHKTACWRFDSRPAHNRQSKEVAMGRNRCQKPEALMTNPKTAARRRSRNVMAIARSTRARQAIAPMNRNNPKSVGRSGS
jgi:DNA-binding transcriptional ArsR family regulator